MSIAEKLKDQGWYLTENGLNKISESGKIIDIKQIIKKALDTDLRDIGGGGLPIELNKGGKLESISGNVVVQILKIRNISAPRANEESKVAPRFFKLQITDGITQYSGIEIEEIPSINFNTAPGTKLLLKSGTINISQGLLLLNGNNVSNLGGKVSSLYEKWDFNRALAKYAKGGRFSLAASGPPPWITFGQKIQQNIPNDKQFKSLSTEGKEPKKENSEFNELRKDAIAEASKVETKKIFGGGSKLLVDANVQKIMDSGFTENEAKFALKCTHNNVEKALINLKRLEERNKAQNDTNYKGEKFARKSRNDPSHESQKPSGKISLFEFLEDKLPMKIESASTTTSFDKDNMKGNPERKGSYDNNRFENNISASFASRNKSSESIPKKVNNVNSSSMYYKHSSGVSNNSNYVHNNNNYNNNINNSSKNTSTNYNPKNSFNNASKYNNPKSTQILNNEYSSNSNNVNNSNTNSNGLNSKYKANYYDKSMKAPRFQQFNAGNTKPINNAKVLSSGNYSSQDYKVSSQSHFHKNASTARSNLSNPVKKMDKNNKESEQFIDKFSGLAISENSCNILPPDSNNEKSEVNLSGEIIANGVTYNPYKIIGFQNKLTNEFAMNVLKGQNPQIAVAGSTSKPEKLATSSKMQSGSSGASKSGMSSTTCISSQSMGAYAIPTNMNNTPKMTTQIDQNSVGQSMHYQNQTNIANIYPMVQGKPHMRIMPTQRPHPPPNDDSGHVWNIGDRCLARYWEDEQFYVAQITGISINTYVVMFMGYGNFEEVLKTDICPVAGPMNRPPANSNGNLMFTEQDVWSSVAYPYQAGPVQFAQPPPTHMVPGQHEMPMVTSMPPPTINSQPPLHQPGQPQQQQQQKGGQSKGAMPKKPPMQPVQQDVQSQIPPLYTRQRKAESSGNAQPRQPKYREQAMYVPPAQRK